MPKRMRDFRDRVSSSAFHSCCISYSSVLPHGDWHLLQSGASLSFSALTFCIMLSIEALSKLTFVTVVNSPSIMTWLVFLETAVVLSTALARPINAPVSSSCNFAVSAVFPQTPEFPVHPLHPIVCSHWKQNIFLSITIFSFYSKIFFIISILCQ